MLFATLSEALRLAVNPFVLCLIVVTLGPCLFVGIRAHLTMRRKYVAVDKIDGQPYEGSLSQSFPIGRIRIVQGVSNLPHCELTQMKLWGYGLSIAMCIYWIIVLITTVA